MEKLTKKTESLDSSSPKLFAKGLVKRFGSRTVVNDVALEIDQGKVIGLLGPNGAGKTTSFYMIVGLLRPDLGNVHLGEMDITDLPLHRRARIGIGYLPQEASIFQKLTVLDNVMAVLEMTTLTRAQMRVRADELLADFRIDHIRHSLGYMLSGGERRRVEIARALALDPKFLLLDEPFAGIDPIAVQDIQSIIAALKNRGIGILITDHNVRETLKICDEGYILSDGKILERGTPEQIASSERARSAYLGEKFQL